jgi:hypothetical protein
MLSFNKTSRSCMRRGLKTSQHWQKMKGTVYKARKILISLKNSTTHILHFGACKVDCTWNQRKGAPTHIQWDFYVCFIGNNRTTATFSKSPHSTLNVVFWKTCYELCHSDVKKHSKALFFREVHERVLKD